MYPFFFLFFALFLSNIQAQESTIPLPSSDVLIENVRDQLSRLQSGSYTITHRFKWITSDSMTTAKIDRIHFECNPRKGQNAHYYAIPKLHQTTYALSDSVVHVDHAKQQYEVVKGGYALQNIYAEHCIFQPLRLDFWSEKNMTSYDTSWVELGTTPNTYILHFFIAEEEI